MILLLLDESGENLIEPCFDGEVEGRAAFLARGIEQPATLHHRARDFVNGFVDRGTAIHHRLVAQQDQIATGAQRFEVDVRLHDVG